MSPAEDAALLLGIVRRHLRTLQLGIEAEIPEEDWGFLAQQALEKILKAWIVLADRRGRVPLRGVKPEARMP